MIRFSGTYSAIGMFGLCRRTLPYPDQSTFDRHSGIQVFAALATEVHVTLEDGSTLIHSFVVGEGLVSDQSHVLIYGLGAQKAIRVFIKALDGFEQEFVGEFRNQLLDI